VSQNEAISTADAASAENVSVEFAGKDGKSIKAVNGVSFSVHLRETFGLIGESGSGKSTLGRMIVCLLKPSSGRIVHGTIDPNTLTSAELRRHRRDFQMIFQDPNAALDPRMTILQSVREPLDIVGERGKRARTEAAYEALERVGIAPDLAKRYPHELSGGTKAAGQYRARADAESEGHRMR
jgi:ABC-type glutathione transport system ATPase component